ncbi:hypothetical protein [Paenibacillus sp. An7]|uniref:hypothetical protein n=1 Tax=Paenibacillus sp. An7 TaxID=2689577 RepID=UPI0013597F18|nr:hypothetical protein [Paenibacillus sp. An7]
MDDSAWNRIDCSRGFLGREKSKKEISQLVTEGGIIIKNPMGIKIIGWFQIFGALVVLFTINMEQNPPFNERFSVPFIPELFVKLALVVIAMIIAYGFLKHEIWGYWSMLIYSILFSGISFLQAASYQSQPYIGNAIYAGFVAIYTLLHFKYFTGFIDRKGDEGDNFSVEEENI